MYQPVDYVSNIRRSELTIYDHIEIGDPALWIPSVDLEVLLRRGLQGLSLSGLPLRTRSKFVKEHICRTLGYPVPAIFKRTKPRFPGQLFDTYVQKSDNLQIWNEEIQATRRYVLIRVSRNDIVSTVRVVTGDTLSKLDTTGTLTQKYQARLILGTTRTELVTPLDTMNIRSLLIDGNVPSIIDALPTDNPSEKTLLPILEVHRRISELVGIEFADTGVDQERNRGAQLHQLICEAIGYQEYRDDGRFPDIRNQLIEVKLQTSPTIDLGLVRPDSAEVLDIPHIRDRPLHHCDVRYVIFHGTTDGRKIKLQNLLL